MAKRRRNLQEREFWDSANKNTASYIQYYNRLVELAISMFEWKNLPSTVDPRYLELALFTDGKAVFFRDDVIGEIALRCSAAGEYDIYGIPKYRRAYAYNGVQFELDEEDSVMIYNNMLHTNSMLDCRIFAERLHEIDRTIEVNVKAQKTPVILSCDENQRLTLLNVYKNYEGNEPVIFGDKNLKPDSLKSINTGAPYIGDKLTQLKVSIWNEALTYLGISNVNVQKKERLLMDEVQRNLGGVIASRYSRLESRRQACDKINDMFGLDIWCDYREDYQMIEKSEDTVEGEPDSEGAGGTATTNEGVGADE